MQVGSREERRMYSLAKIGLAALLMVWVLRQVRKPAGPLGRRMLRAMNLAHSALTEWGLQHVEISKDASILDIGCGGGRTVQRLASLAREGKVVGVDYSKASVAASSETNVREIEEGRVQIRLGAAEALPCPDRSFDLATAVETHYYWPDLPGSFREVFRVLKPGGMFALIAETGRNGWWGALYAVPMRLIGAAHLSDAELRTLLERSGFTQVSTMHRTGRPWVCTTARRP
jgi:ubiquinone/menaquinone biosynthesis C-methylase UbiE